MNFANAGVQGNVHPHYTRILPPYADLEVIDDDDDRTRRSGDR
jgi:hypothetical protein